MEINKENYEIFIIDYYDGAISEEAKLQLFAFLEANPELKAEFESYDNISISEIAPALTFDFKESLKKNNVSGIINETNCNEYFIADAEGDLTAVQKKQLGIFLSQNPDLFNDYELIKKLKLIPDQQIVFQQKAKLKRYALFGMQLNKKIIYQTASIAASFLLIAGISSLFYNNIIEKPSDNFKNITAGISAYNTDKTNQQQNAGKTLNTIKSDNNTIVVSQKNNNKELLAQATKKEDISNIQTETERISISGIVSKETTLLANKSSDEIKVEDRLYYTSLLDLMAFTDERPNIESIEISPEKFKEAILNTDLVKNQPIAEAGSFIKNVAIVGLSKLESLGTDIKDGYLAVEKRFERK